MKKNPFIFGKIVPKENFCNRKNEIRQLINYITDGYSVWLYSPRRYGKSSLIRRVFEEAENIKTVYFDLYNIQTLDDFCRKYSKLLAQELFDWKDDIKQLTKKMGQFFKNLYPVVSFDEKGMPSFSLTQNNIEKQEDIETILSIAEMVAKHKKQQICIAFDEFQEIKRIEPFLINWMRSSFQKQQNVSYIFLGSKQSLMNTIFTSINSPFYEFAVKMDIQPIPSTDLKKFINEKFKSKGIQITSKNVDEILNKSECHPHFTQYFAATVFDLIRNGENQNDKNFTGQWLERIINSQSHIFQNIYDRLNLNQRRILTALAQNGSNIELFASDIKNKYQLPSSSTLNTSLKGLINKDLINKQGSKYKIINPVFKEWLKELYSGNINS